MPPKVKKLSTAIALLLVMYSLCFLAFPRAAQAQATKIAVVDRNLITRESSAARAMRALIETKYQRYQGEIKAAQNALEKARDDLKRQSPQLNQDAIKKRRTEIHQQANDLSRILQIRKGELDQMVNKGMAQIDKVLEEILKILARKHGINMIINATKSQRIVLFIDKNLVLTEEALKLLNERLPEVKMASQPGQIKGR
jgi:Skp family chaperone for outer membrane proteins